ncbi:MAG TPA: lipopolysaccharide biosynthesis protein [Thermoguttaceae bacterium]|nr:lipopolysaccharide biosynthesis protein [Thermoguttaceae bacterium]
MSTPAEALLPTTIDRPLNGWRRVFGDWLVVGSATAVCHVLGAATSLLLRWLLSPAQMGIWQALKLFLSYGNYANLGISKGAVREFNVALGSGRTDRARRGLNLAFTVNMLTSALYAAVLVGVGLWIALTGNSVWATQWAVGLLAVGAVAVLVRYVTFHVTILRANQDFTTTSQLSILEGLLTLSVCGLATWRWGLPGLYGGTLVVLLASLAFIRRRAAAVLRPAWDTAEIRRLIAIGAPILLAGTVSSLFRSLDKLMILAYLSDREFQLGCYSVALMVTAQLFGLGNVLSMVTGPRYGETFGRTGDRRCVARLAARAGELQAAAMALPAALALIAAPPVLARLLPDYETGLAPLKYLVPGAVALVLALPGSQYLIAVGRQRRALAAVLIATAVAVLGNHLALSGGYGLSGVAAATAAAYGVYFLLVSAVSLWGDLDGSARTRYVAMLALAVGPTVGLALWLGHSSSAAEAHWPTVAANAAAVLAVWGLTIACGWHRGGWGKEFRGTRQP